MESMIACFLLVFSKPNILDRAEAAVLRSLGLAGYALADLAWFGTVDTEMHKSLLTRASSPAG